MGIGKIALRVRGALLGGKLEATLSAPSINSADLPIALPLTKPVEIRDLRIVAHAPYPLKQGPPLWNWRMSRSRPEDPHGRLGAGGQRHVAGGATPR